MVAESVINRERGHRLLESLPDEKVSLVVDLLEALTPDPVDFMDVAYEEESLSDFARQAISEGREDLGLGRKTSHDEVRQEFGL